MPEEKKAPTATAGAGQGAPAPKPAQAAPKPQQPQEAAPKPAQPKQPQGAAPTPQGAPQQGQPQRPQGAAPQQRPQQAAPKPAQPQGQPQQPQAAPKPAQPPQAAPKPPPAPEEPGAGPEAPEEDTRERLKGVFSTQSVQKVGTGTTARKTIQKMYWYAVELDDGTLEVQALNVNQVPSGPKNIVTKDDLLENYAPEPEFHQQTVFPKMRELVKTISRAERHRKRGEYFSAEFEFQNALNVDEENVRANFGLGLTYLERGETSKANNIFERLVKLDAAFEKEHKHLFNEFGIKLRKNKMYDQSVDYYERAMSLSEADENLHYNIARAYFDKREIDKTKDHLLKALQMNSEHEAAKHFLEWMKEKKLLTPEAEGKKEGAPTPKPEEGK